MLFHLETNSSELNRFTWDWLESWTRSWHSNWQPLYGNFLRVASPLLSFQEWKAILMWISACESSLLWFSPIIIFVNNYEVHRNDKIIDVKNINCRSYSLAITDYRGISESIVDYKIRLLRSTPNANLNHYYLVLCAIS